MNGIIPCVAFHVRHLSLSLVASGSVLWHMPALLSFSLPNHVPAEGFISPHDLEDEVVEVKRAVRMLCGLVLVSGLMGGERTS